MLNQIRIVLINTSHPGNIGAAARAMMTMDLHELYLVAPEVYPHPKAVEMSAGANAILDAAKVVPTLAEAIADCSLVLGTSARDRRIPWPLQSPRQMVESLAARRPAGKVAILFGRERIGLTNDELERCHFHIQIPANPDYSSLNIAAAVQILAYELYVMFGAAEQQLTWDYALADGADLELFFSHLEAVLTKIQFLKLNAPRRLMTRLRRLFYRTQLDQMEVNMLRGILTAVEQTAKELKHE